MLATDRNRRYLIAGGVTLAGLGGLGYMDLSQLWRLIRRMAAESEIPVETPLHFPSPKHRPDKGFYAAWLGHITVLIKADGYTILTEPVFGEKAGIDLYVYTLGIKRIVAPALSAKDLPPSDRILSSHAHLDRLDTRSLRSLVSKQTQIVMAVETSDLIRASRYAKTNRRGYNGYTVEVNGRRILFAGAEILLPVHHQTFRLSNEPPLEPIQRFLDASVSRPERVGWTTIGQEFRLA